MNSALVLTLILLLAVVLIVGGLVLSRRSQRAAGPPASPPIEAPTRPPVAAPSAGPVAAEPVGEEIPAGETLSPPVAEPVVEERPRLRDRLGRTRAALAGAFTGIAGRSTVDDETWEELEEALILADVGVATSTRLVEAVRERAAVERITDPGALEGLLRAEVAALLAPGDRTLHRAPSKPTVWMFVGVNGVGKTTTIAKLAQREVGEGNRVVLAAADTFRAAAAEQLGTWAERTGAWLVRGQEGADPGSVVFDAMASAQTRDSDLVLVDTAGRLHTKVNLMEELKKLRRIVDRTPDALTEVLLVIDATTGQNGLAQAREFAQAVEVTGVVLTKLDGTAKGGIVLAIQAELGIPVKVVGIGEGAADMVPFDPEEFAAALFGD
jgi:fused signal recognition particle receptor